MPTETTSVPGGTGLATAKVDTHHDVQVIHYGDAITLPANPNEMPIPTAIKILQQRQEWMSKPMEMSATFDVFPWDGALALSNVLKKKFGWVMLEGHPNWLGIKQPPTFIQVEVAPGKYESVAWGQFNVPSTSIVLSCTTGRKDGRMVFTLAASMIRTDEQYCKGIFDDLREYLRHNSIYRGKAIKIRFLDDDGDMMSLPTISFIDTATIDPSQLIFSTDIKAQVDAYLFTPIKRVRELEANGIRIKRSIILGGIYGTGKTLAAMVASKKAVDTGITFIYVARADELPHALAFGKQYQSPAAVVFCEDVDRVTSGERNIAMDDLLNMVDGLDTKKDHIVVILTTNRLEDIHPAMIRRATVIEVFPPDALAVEQLLRKYAGDAILAETDLSEVGKVLAGNTPSVIADTLEKAKLSQLMLNSEGQAVKELSANALLVAAKYMARQIQLSRDPVVEEKPTIDKLVTQAAASALNGGGGNERAELVNAIVQPLAKQLKAIRENM